MIRRRYPTPREIRQAQWTWIPLLIPLLLLTWFGYRDIALNIQKRRLDYELNQLTQRNRDITRRLESVSASLAAKRGYWTSTAFAQSIGLQPPEPGQVIAVPAIPLNWQIWELTLEPSQGQQALFATVSVAPAPTMSEAVPGDLHSHTASVTHHPDSAKPQASATSVSTPPSPKGGHSGNKRASTTPKAPAKPAAPTATTPQKNLKPASPEENPAAWIVSL